MKECRRRMERDWFRMMKRPPFTSCGLTVFIVILCVASSASATLVTDSNGTTYLSASGSGVTINIQVDYAVYDGNTATDPLGCQ